MKIDSSIVVDPSETLAALAARLAGQPETPILLRPRLGEWRLLSREEIERLAADPLNTLTAGDISSKGPLPMIFPDESLEEALRWAADWPTLPVVNRGDTGKLDGVLSLSDILHAFRHVVSE
jgi:CBS domain-containing protein